MAEHRRINPDTLFDASAWGFHQVQVTTGFSRIVHMAGQAALDREAKPVAVGDFAGQVEAALANLDLALAAAGVGRGDVASLRIYVVDWDQDKAPALIAGLNGFFGADATPPDTLIGVARLAMPELLVEIEATAIA